MEEDKMAICPKCGSWVDEGDICRNCGGSAGRSSGYFDESQKRVDNYRAEMLGREAWKLYNDYKDEEALTFINQALEYNSRHSKNWNKKAIILESLERFDESKECYDRSLAIKRSNVVIDNKARMIKDYAGLLCRQGYLKFAMTILEEAISEISSIPTEEDIAEYEKLLEAIRDRYRRGY